MHRELPHIYIFVYNPGYIPPCLFFSDMLALLLMEVCSRGAGLTFSSGYVPASTSYCEGVNGGAVLLMGLSVGALWSRTMMGGGNLSEPAYCNTMPREHVAFT